jgi:hypothetical protein
MMSGKAPSISPEGERNEEDIVEEKVFCIYLFIFCFISFYFLFFPLYPLLNLLPHILLYLRAYPLYEVESVWVCFMEIFSFFISVQNIQLWQR